MVLTRSTRLGAAVVAGALLLAAGCSSDGESSSSTTAEPAGPTPITSMEPRLPTEITAPPAEGKGVNVPQPNSPLPEGYIEEEYLVGGTATSFVSVDTPDDGFWTVALGDEAEYRTRVIVRRPADAAAFSGNVLVEWFNVSALEASPAWAFTSEEIGREGHVYVGVSAQAQGVEGGETVLEVEADEEQAADAGADADASGLKNIDPERYGTLTHPGDQYAYDLYGQIGRAVAETPDQLLGDLEPEYVIATGESQSATFLTTYIDAVNPVDPVYDGFFVHSRLGGAAPLDGEAFVRDDATDEEVEEELGGGVLIRTDVEVPVMIFETETDLTLLGYAAARQPDTDMIRTWEVAGTSHADAQFIRAVIGGPRDPSVGSFLGCEGPINTGPQKEVLQAALNHLVTWVDGGPPPPEGVRIELDEGDEVVIVRDENGNAVGGVRTPMVDVPVAALSGDAPEEEPAEEGEGRSVCFLFGSTTPFDQATLVDLYGDADTYVEEFRASAEEAVAAGFLLQPDADALIAEAEENRSLFP